MFIPAVKHFKKCDRTSIITSHLVCKKLQHVFWASWNSNKTGAITFMEVELLATNVPYYQYIFAHLASHMYAVPTYFLVYFFLVKHV